MKVEVGGLTLELWTQQVRTRCRLLLKNGPAIMELQELMFLRDALDKVIERFNDHEVDGLDSCSIDYGWKPLMVET